MAGTATATPCRSSTSRGNPVSSGTAAPLRCAPRPSCPSKTTSKWTSRWKTSPPSSRRIPPTRRSSPPPSAPGNITPQNIGLAIENFLLTRLSFDSKLDRSIRGKATLTEEEQRGFKLFFTESEPRLGKLGADCFHCHGGALFTDHSFHNNGLFPTDDHGLEKTTGLPTDRYKFSTPSLRNVALTAPYMHDGRFATLEEVIDHYNSPVPLSETLDPNLAKHPQGLGLSDTDKKDLVAFLKTLSTESP